MYKLISNGLTARFHGVISSISSEAQTGFIPGRKVAHNVILARELVKEYSRKHNSLEYMIKFDL